ncbi:uncharacterized protein [Apostichopus japonicus]|uniref:uncharacterized protein isoform X2 n=1 Tax=Stichopus japonicus TaxID=307972 RepID=UPI003AB52A7B
MLSFIFVTFSVMGVFLHPVKGCNVSLADTTGTFSSPNYPSSYQPNLICGWQFEAPSGMVIEITFDQVDLPGNSTVCSDLIQIFDGDVVASSLVSSFCDDGPGWPRLPTRFLSTSNRFNVTMVTDGSVDSNTGFTARYRQVAPRIEYVAAVAIDSVSIIKFDRFRTKGLPQITLPEATRPSALTFDPIENYFYYTDVDKKFIGRVKEDGSQFDILTRDGIDYPIGIVAGYLTGLLYWTDRNRSEVSVSRLDGSFRKTIVSSSSGCQSPRGIVLSSDHQFVFWTCATSIERSKADGSDRQVIVGGLNEVRSLAIDPEGEKLYWINAVGSLGRVDQINIDGTGGIGVYSAHELFGAIHGFVIDAFCFFWTHPGDRRIYFLERGEVALRHVGLVNSPPMMEGLYYYNSERIIPEQHQCAFNNGGCRELCFPNGVTYTCEEVTPLVSDCPSDIVMLTTIPRAVSWGEPTAISRSYEPTPVSVESISHSPGSTFFFGSTEVSYVFSDGFGYEAVCTFMVTLSRSTTTKATKTTKATTTLSRPFYESLFDEYLWYTIVGIGVVAVCLLISLIVCISCCCGCCQCNCKRKPRRPTVDDPSFTKGTDNAMYMTNVIPQPGPPQDYYTTIPHPSPGNRGTPYF